MLKPKITRSLVKKLGHKTWPKHHKFLTLNFPIVNVTLKPIFPLYPIFQYFKTLYYIQLKKSYQGV